MTPFHHPDFETLERDLADIASALAARYPDIRRIKCIYVELDQIRPKVAGPEPVQEEANRMLAALGWELYDGPQERCFWEFAAPHETAHDRLRAIQRIHTAMATAALERLADTE